MALIDDVKTYLRVDGGEDDSILALLIGSAEEYLANAGVPESVKDTEQYKLTVILLVANDYENRNPAIDASKISFSLQSKILQLKKG